MRNKNKNKDSRREIVGIFYALSVATLSRADPEIKLSSTGSAFLFKGYS